MDVVFDELQKNNVNAQKEKCRTTKCVSKCINSEGAKICKIHILISIVARKNARENQIFVVERATKRIRYGSLLTTCICQHVMVYMYLMMN